MQNRENSKWLLSFSRDRQKEKIAVNNPDLMFMMQNNGYLLGDKGKWEYHPESADGHYYDFDGLAVGFSGPGLRDAFFRSGYIDETRYAQAFSNPGVLKVMQKLRGDDEEQAGKIAYLLGGIVRSRYELDSIFNLQSRSQTNQEVSYTADMIGLTDTKSAEATAAAIAMYLRSNGPAERDPSFEREVIFMADAISRDPITPKDTKDLGISQLARLRRYQRKEDFPDIDSELKAFADSPTVGAEFHILPDQTTTSPHFWQRLALLNMSQYQHGSYVQFARNDHGVIEIRMNPSSYPVTIATWQEMRKVLPELDDAYFSMTYNRNTFRDFSWRRDQILLNKLRSVGMVSFASSYDEEPSYWHDPHRISFGGIYLGQTVRFDSDKYQYTGRWVEGEGDDGQLSIFAGVGHNFPLLAYYPTMVLTNPAILDPVGEEFFERTQTMSGALDLKPATLKGFFNVLQNAIAKDSRLKNIHTAGYGIMEKLGVM